jgi:predicted dehydrogenase
MAAPLRAAVVGVGAIGSLHARIYRDDPRTDLIAVADPDAERARAVADALGATAYGDVTSMLERERLDIASIATPEQHRHDPAVACAAAGVHLLLEKPLAPSLDAVDRLVAAVERAGVVATANFILRAEPRYADARARIAGGAVGEPVSFFARRRGTAAGAEIYAPWTDLMRSTAIHDLDAMAWLAGGGVERVHAEGVSRRSAQWGKEDAVAAVLRFRNGAVGLLETSWVLPSTLPAPLDVSLHVVGTGGGIFIDGADHGLAVVGADRYERPDLAHWPLGPSGVEGALRGSVSAFIRAVADGAQPLMSLAEARTAQQLAEAVIASIRGGRTVTL